MTAEEQEYISNFINCGKQFKKAYRILQRFPKQEQKQFLKHFAVYWESILPYGFVCYMLTKENTVENHEIAVAVLLSTHRKVKGRYNLILHHIYEILSREPENPYAKKIMQKHHIIKKAYKLLDVYHNDLQKYSGTPKGEFTELLIKAKFPQAYEIFRTLDEENKKKFLGEFLDGWLEMFVPYGFICYVLTKDNSLENQDVASYTAMRIPPYFDHTYDLELHHALEAFRFQQTVGRRFYFLYIRHQSPFQPFSREEECRFADEIMQENPKDIMIRAFIRNRFPEIYQKYHSERS